MFIKQGSAVIRIVSFAVAIAIVLGLASVMFQVTASAEAVSNVNALDLSAHQIGALGNYPVIGLPTSQLLADYIATADPNSTNGIVDYFVPFTVYNGVVYYSDNLASITYRCSYYDRLPVCTVVLGGQISLNPIYDSIKSGSDTPTKPTDYRYLEFTSDRNVVTSHYTTYPNDFYKCTYAFKSSKGDILSDTNVSSIMYARVLSSPYNVTVDTNSSSYIKDTDSFADMESLNLPSAKFITCASFTNADGSFPLWVKDFIAEGHQYPMFTFAISDNGNNHKYSMVLSYNDNDLIAPFIVGMYDELSDSDKRTGFKLTTAISKKFHVSGFVGITNMSDVLKKGCINIFEKNWVNLTYNRAFNLNSSDMDFTDTTGNKVYTITLSDYSAIKANTFYKAELIDLTTSEVLDVTYFTSAQSFNKSDSGNGTKIYDYGDNYDQMWDDLKNNTPSVDPSKGDNFNVGGDVDTNFDNLSNLNINDIISGLRTSISSVSVFFQACWSLFPAAFWSIILLGVSLIIILRILGR